MVAQRERARIVSKVSRELGAMVEPGACPSLRPLNVPAVYMCPLGRNILDEHSFQPLRRQILTEK